MGMDELARCADDPAHLGSCFRKIGFESYDRDMLERCSAFMRMAPAVDFQFDIMADGTLGDTFGLSLSFAKVRPREAKACMTDGYGARLMDVLQGWGLADDRWRLIADAVFARRAEFERDDGSTGQLALCVLLNYAKVKFVDGVARPAKFYLILAASELLQDVPARV
jgi:hypothetical protein